MKKLVNNKFIDNDKLETFFKSQITSEEVYNFLSENSIDYQEAMKYFSEFKMFEENPKKYKLEYQYETVVLKEKEKTINPGVYYLGEEYFSEDKTLEAIDYVENSTKTEVIHEFLSNPYKGLYICSDNGRGKTTLAVALSNQHYDKTNKKTLFVFWPDFIEKTKRFDNDNIYFINKVKYAPRLIIDDLGQESITQWARDDVLHPIISYRLEKKLPTFVTSNYKIKELEKIYTFRTIESKKTKSIIEKLKALASEIVITGEDFRNKK